MVVRAASHQSVEPENDNKRESQRVVEFDNEFQKDLVHTTTRISLTCITALLSSFCVQFIFIYTQKEYHERIYWIDYMWNIDAIINMICIYFSMVIGNNHYTLVCNRCCKCHQCCLRGIMKIIAYDTERTQDKIACLKPIRSASDGKMKTSQVVP